MYAGYCIRWHTAASPHKYSGECSSIGPAERSYQATQPPFTHLPCCALLTCLVMQIENLKDDSEVTITIFAVAALDGDPSVVVGRTVR